MNCKLWYVYFASFGVFKLLKFKITSKNKNSNLVGVTVAGCCGINSFGNHWRNWGRMIGYRCNSFDNRCMVCKWRVSDNLTENWENRKMTKNTFYLKKKIKNKKKHKMPKMAFFSKCLCFFLYTWSSIGMTNVWWIWCIGCVRGVWGSNYSSRSSGETEQWQHQLK